ncbi:hypothetical protein CK203_039132 [Vitis vinifera]|uniref:Uncharacterized protein n=1 Tax=Vitis vinifera TaxID=29760 RepID=A0A438IFN1_VITVI|nr:hypothetical protein CK203_039132 [Vitis vinifera]
MEIKSDVGKFVWLITIVYGCFQLERFHEDWKEGEGKKGEIRPPKLKTEDPNKSYVQRPVKRG